MINTISGLVPKLDAQGNPIVDVNGNYVINEELSVDFEDRTTIGVVGYVVEQSGYDYLPAPDGSLGGDGRTWAEVVDTTIRREDGTYEIPIPPNNVFCVKAGDTVNIPFGTEVITEPFNNKGGGEIVRGGGPHVMESDGCFTTPLPTYEQMAGYYPALGTGAYPVITYLCEIEIEQSGFGYNSEVDQIVIEPNAGAEVTFKTDIFGAVTEVNIEEQGEGFTNLPEIYIQSATGYQAKLLPKLCAKRIGPDEFEQPKLQDKILSVVDCVGSVPKGYLRGNPYFGPTHIHNGVRMVGENHTDQPHDTLTDRP